MNDLISRQAAIEFFEKAFEQNLTVQDTLDGLKDLPSAEREHHFDEWCTECKEYDQERHCCPRFNHVIRTTLQEVQENQKKGKWIYYESLDAFECSVCGGQMARNVFYYCPWCGADMRGEQDDNN